MNNKGQTLVVFVILLPLILLIFVGLIDIGNLYINKRNINNILDKAVEYKKEGKNIEEFINKNIDDCEIINDENSITIEKNVQGILKKYNIKVTKKG